MTPSWAYLDPAGRDTFRTTRAFLEKRLAEQGTIDWALRLKTSQHIERTAVTDLLNGPVGHALGEPWATAWRLIEESWLSSPLGRDDGTAIYGIQERLRTGDRSGVLVASIVNLVAPRLRIDPSSSWHMQFVKKPHKPRSFNDLLSVGLTSGELIDLNVLELHNLTDIAFLRSLADALDAAVNYGLDMARRIGWRANPSFFGRGMLNCVYYTQTGRKEGPDWEPDAHHRGIAPSAKLFYAIVSRIADLEPETAQQYIQRLSLNASPLHVRLWAALSRNSQLTSAEQVGAFLQTLDDYQFWELHIFPEIAELRARRFRDLDDNAQKAITSRIKKGPPRHRWPRKAETAKVTEARLYWAVRELKRIEVGGAKLPASSRYWLDARITKFPDLARMMIDEGFPEGPSVRQVRPNPDDKYDVLEGAARLHALETALSTSRGGWDDDPAERANDWLSQPEKTALVLCDLEADGNGGNDFPRVWNRFGWAHSPNQAETAEAAQRNLQGEVVRVLALLELISEKTLSAAIEGVSHWLSAWSKQVAVSFAGLPVWLRVWPIAVASTNSRPESDDDADLGVTEREPMKLDTLNPPVAKLVDVFLSGCPTIAHGSQAFSAGSAELQMRDAVIASTGRSGLIARHRLIEQLPYFWRADQNWTMEHLIAPLSKKDDESLALWRAIARRIHFTEVLKIIGDAMAERATDQRLERETRQMLVFSLVFESLHAFRDNREPAVPNPLIQQMLRTLDDEVRASAAGAIQQFVGDLSTSQPADQNAPSAADLFRSAATPFLRDVWPQERSLATPGVSSAFADLPATSGDAFAEAVDAIARFLVQFDCWSMIDYGLYGDDGETKKLSIINDETKARAFLLLLDLTIGSSEGAVIPHDLTDALDQIRSVTPVLVDSPAFRRLSTAARR